MIRITQTLTLSAPAALLHWLPGPAGGADSDRPARLSPESCSVRPAVPAPPPSAGLSAVQQPAGSASALAFQRGVQVCSGQPRQSLSINGLTLTSYYKEEMCKCSKIWLLRSVSILQILCDAVRLWSEAATSLSYKPTHSETCRAHSNSYAAQVTEHQRAPNLHFTHRHPQWRKQDLESSGWSAESFWIIIYHRHLTVTADREMEIYAWPVKTVQMMCTPNNLSCFKCNLYLVLYLALLST